jgi:hypothetical protein
MRTRVLLSLAVLVIVAPACSRHERPDNQQQEFSKADASSLIQYDPASASAVVSGRILLDGTPPARDPMQMSADPYCARASAQRLSDEIIVTGGGLENVMLYVESTPEHVRYATPSEPIILDQHACVYQPRVLTMMVNQALQIRNSDASLHNVNVSPKNYRPFNFGQPVKGMTVTRHFENADPLVRFRCDVHRWMSAYVGVFAHPFHTVSGEGGAYELKLPPGIYRIVAWHEKYGSQVKEIVVADKERKILTYSFSHVAS